MPKSIFLDTFPLSSVCKIKDDPNSSTEQCQEWIKSCIISGNAIYVPEISYYEVIRELKLVNATRQIERLRLFSFAIHTRFIPISSTHIEEASNLWAVSRKAGRSTSSKDSLDGDVILCAQVLGLSIPSYDFVVATTNPKHLIQFVPAENWFNIVPGT